MNAVQKIAFLGKNFKRNTLKRLLAVASALSVLVTAAPVPAEEITQTIMTRPVRVNLTECEISVTVLGAPNTQVIVELLYPEAKPPLSNTREVLENTIAYMNQLKTDESGELNFRITGLKRTGIYTLRIRGAVESIDYVTYNNTTPIPPATDKLFVASFKSYGPIVAEDFQYMTGLSQSNLNGGAKSAAREIKAQLDQFPSGRKFLLITAAGLTPRDKGIWLGEIAYQRKAQLEEFFRVLYEIGGEVDYIHTDYEQLMSNWMLGWMARRSGFSSVAQLLEAISQDERYINEIRPLLAERGFDFTLPTSQEDKDNYGDCELWRVANFGGSNNYHIWNAVMNEIYAKQLNEIIWEPALKYFPNVAYSEYILYDLDSWYYINNDIYKGHATYKGGNYIKAGTHSSPDMYGAWTTLTQRTVFEEEFSDKNQPIEYYITFAEINKARAAMLSNPTQKIQPWISTYDYVWNVRYTPYYYEYFFHIGLLNPDPFLYFDTYDPTVDNFRVDTETQLLNDRKITEAIKELNEVVGYADRKTLVKDLGTYTSQFILSGMYAGGRNVWRITPDIKAYAKKTTNAADFPRVGPDGDRLLTTPNGSQIMGADAVATFKVADDPPTFEINNRRIVFPGGQIITPESGSNAPYGFWVETPAGVEPEITTITPLDDTRPNEYQLRLYNLRTGMRIGSIPENDGIAGVLAYRNHKSYSIPVVLCGAWYNEDGSLAGVVSSDTRLMYPYEDGRIVVKLPEEVKNFSDVRFFFFNGETLEPLRDKRSITH